MSNNEGLMAEIIAIAEEVFDLDEADIEATTSKDAIDEWDSLGHITLLAAIEKRFSIRFTIDEAQSASSIEKLTETIEKKMRS